MATSNRIQERINAFARQLCEELDDVDASKGVCWLDAIENEDWGLELFIKNAFDERAEIGRTTQCGIFQPDTPDDGTPPLSTPLCGLQPYTITNLPRTIGLTFTKHF